LKPTQSQNDPWPETPEPQRPKPGPTVTEMRLWEESHRYKERMWEAILWGAIWGGSVFLGRPPVGGPIPIPVPVP
jgi:hypothetical protein